MTKAKLRPRPAPAPPPSAATYRNFMADLRSGGNWTAVPSRLCVALKSANAAMLLLTLVNAACGSRGPEADGYVLAYPSFIQRGCGLPQKTQQKVLAKLRRLGLVTTYHQGKAPYHRVNLDAVRRLLEGQE